MEGHRKESAELSYVVIMVGRASGESWKQPRCQPERVPGVALGAACVFPIQKIPGQQRSEFLVRSAGKETYNRNGSEGGRL